MNELVKVTTNENGEQLVSARELHKYLDVKKKFSSWWEQYENMFVDNEDYTRVLQSYLVKSGNGANRLYDDLALKLDIAKHISMLTKTPKGEEARKYFIKLEKMWNSPEMVTKRALEFQQVKIEQLQTENEQLKPKAMKYDSYIQAKGTINVSIIAKNYGMCARKFNELLHELGIQYKQKNTWLLYAKYQDKKYTHIEGFTYKDSDGIENIKTTTKWTANGHMFLYDLLKSHGYYPNIELMDSEDDTFKMVERRA